MKYYLSDDVGHSCCYEICIKKKTDDEDGDDYIAEFSDKELAEKVVEFLNSIDNSN